MPLFELDVRGTVYQIEAPDDASAASAATALASRPQHREFDESGLAPERQPSGLLAAATSAVEGIPVAGPYLRQGAENVAGGLGSLLSGRSQQEVSQEMSQMATEAQEANPGTSLASGVAGGVLGTLPLILAAPGAFGAGAAGLLGRSAASALSGSALGSADAGVRSGGNPEAMLEGGAWGFGLGAAAPGIGQLVGKGVGNLASRVRGPAKAESALVRAAGDDAVQDIPARLQQMGPDAMPMDLGPNLQRQAGAIAATPGRGQDIIRSAIAERQGAAGSRVSTALDEALGQPADTLSLAEDIIAKRSAAAKPLYEAAYSKPVPFTRELEDLLTRPSVGRALSKARGLAADEGIPSQQWFANIADDGTVTIKSVPDVRQLDLTKRALDDMISSAQRAGSNNEARILTGSKNKLLEMIDDAVPEYAAAREAFSGPTAVLDALEEGQKAFSSSLTPSQMRAQLSGMGSAEREAFVQGARAQVANIMGTARNDALAARSSFQKGYNKEKLDILVGPKQAKSLLDSLDAETAFTRTRDVVTGNSETAARLAAQADVGAGSKQPGLIRSLDISKPGDILARMGDKLTGGVRNAAQVKSNEELAKLLTSKDPATLRRTVQTVMAAQKRGDISAQKAKEIVNSLMLSASMPRRPLELTVTPNRAP